MDWPLQQEVIPSANVSLADAAHRLAAAVSLPEGTALQVVGASFLLLATTEPLLEAARARILQVDPGAEWKKPQLNYFYGKPTLEPYAVIEMRVPSESAWRVLSDLRHSRRAFSVTESSEGERVFIQAELPMAELFGYSTSLRSLVQHPCAYEQVFSGYKPVPGSDGPVA